MSLDSIVVCHADEWDRTVAGLEGAQALQSWAWGEVKSRWGWTAERRWWQTAGQVTAAAQILHRPIPHTPWSFLYVPRGPVLDYADLPLVTHVLAELEAYARRAGALFIKIDPDVPRQVGEPGEQPPHPVGQAVLSVLERRGWRFSPEQIQFRNTVVLDLTPSEADLLAAMKPKWRYNIRLAERRGVVVRDGSTADLPLFYRMYAETAARDGFLIRPEDYYRDVWQTFLARGQADLLIAEAEGETVAGLMLFVFGRTAWYMYGASTDRHRRLMPNHALQWAAIRRAKARHCTRYDMWGAPDVFNETDRMWGVYRFKQGFGGTTVQGLGAYDYPVYPRLYQLFSVLLPRLRGWMRGG